MDNKKSKFGLGLLFGMTAGIIAGLFASDKPGKKLRQEAGDKYLEIKKMLEEKDADVVIRHIFGQISTETKQIFDKAKDELAIKLSDLQEDWSNIDKDKYKKLVGKVVDGVKVDKKLPEDTIKKLSKYLESDISKIQGKPVKKTVVKSKKKSSKTIKKAIKK